MTVGYAAFQTNLNIKGTSKISSNWDIRITNVTSGTSVGNGENAKTPTWTNLTASMEANLYEKGDVMEYQVTVENKGTFDAKLESISNIGGNNDAIKISFSGYTKGEKLYKNSTQTINVKIEYNKNFQGTAPSNTNEVTVALNYVQAEGGTIEPSNDYLLTYDYKTNGGEGDSETAYLSSNEKVDLSKKGNRDGYVFVGWNTDKNAHTGLSILNMPSENTVLYAIYKKALVVNYTKGIGVSGISKLEDRCEIYNNETSCEITLPSITVSTGYNIDGWYNGSTKVGNQNVKVNINTNTSLVANALEPDPIIKSWTLTSDADFHSTTYKPNIISATFLDNKNVPSNAIASWDVSLNTTGSVMAWIIADTADSTKYHLYIGGKGGVIANENSSFLFFKFPSLDSINFENNFDTSQVTNMEAMFYNCSSLTNLDISSFVTSQVTNMHAMFFGCSNLTSLNVSNFDTSKVTNMAFMFANSGGPMKLQEIKGLNNFDTSNVTNMSTMFQSCSNLTSLDVSNFDTSKVTDMSFMFGSGAGITSKLEKITGLNKFNTSNVTNMSCMFQNHSLKSVDVSSFDTSNVTDMSNMFNGSNSPMTKLNICNFDTSKVTNMESMFSDLPKLTVIHAGPKWTMANVTNITDMFSNDVINTVTQSNNCEMDAEDSANITLSTSKTTKSITAVATASATSGISKYEFSKDNGTTWINNGTSNTYTFTGLTHSTTYNIKVRVSSGVGKQTTSSTVATTTNIISTPTYSETGTTTKKVTITYPNGCGSTYTCSYSKNGAAFTIVTSNPTITFTNDGTLVARVSDGTNTISSSYSVSVIKHAASQLKTKVVTSGDGLYADTYESGRYVYKGANPNNYITFNNEEWRIMAVEADGTLKIIKNASIGNMHFDQSSRHGSNDWARPATLNTYLNNDYYNGLSAGAQNQIQSHAYGIGAVTYGNTDLAGQIASENGTTWTGNIGLVSVSDYLRANTNVEQCGNFSLNEANIATCKTTNYLFSTDYLWTISPDAVDSSYVFIVHSYGALSTAANTIDGVNHAVWPVLHLKSNITLSGEGTRSNPYKIA